MSKKVTTVRAAKTSGEALDRLKGAAVVTRSSGSTTPVKPIRLPGLYRAMKEVRGER
jgi:hypothetical protein